MNKYIYLALSWVMIGLLSSCYDDKGNYDYDYIQSVILREGLKDTVVTRGKVLTLKPEIAKIVTHGENDTTGVNVDDYDYVWYTYNEVTGKRDTLGNRSYLEDTIYLPISDKYRVTFSITEKASGVAWLNQFGLKVIGAYKNGFLFLTEDATGEVELELYGDDAQGGKIRETGMLQRSGFPYRKGGANAVSYISWDRMNIKQIWVATGEATGWLTIPDMVWLETNMATYMMVEAKPISYTFKKMYAYKQNDLKEFFVTDEGEVHWFDPTGAFYSDCAYNGGQKFKASTILGVSGDCILLYNETGKYFLSYSTWSPMYAKSESTRLSGADALEGSDLIYMQGIADGSVIVITKDPDGLYRRYVYVSSLDFSSYPPGAVFKQETNFTQELQNNANMLEEAEHIVLDRGNGFIYFAIGSTLYNYREGGGIDACVKLNDLMFEGEKVVMDEITAMAVVTDGKYNKDVIVATYSAETKGKVYVLRPDQSESRRMEVVEIIPTNEMVKSISYWQ